jgi:zinc finger-like protein
MCTRLQALLPWVTGSFSEEEKEAMMGSLREATKNTMFDQWLGAVQQSGAAAAAAAGASTAAADAQQQQPAAAAGAGASEQQQQQQQQMPMSDLAEIAEYLTGSSSGNLPQGLLPSAAHQQQQQQLCQTEVSGTVAESTNYVPGWEDIFNINQKQLEAAIRRVSNDPNLEPQRKAYLIQNIMVSRYIVAQQRRMQTAGSAAAAAPAAAASGVGIGQLPAGQMLLPPVQQQQHGHAHVHSHAGGCCHHHEQQQQHSQQQQQAVPVQQSSSSMPVQQQPQQQPVRTYADAAAGVLGCKHYRRSAQLVAPCCGKVYTCRCAAYALMVKHWLHYCCSALNTRAVLVWRLALLAASVVWYINNICNMHK